MQIITAFTDDHLRLFHNLFLEYAEELDLRLGSQDWEADPAKLPGQYAVPAGTVLLALDRDHAIGCVVLRRLWDGICEMKRLYVRPQHRRIGVGRHLAESAIEQARRLGYRRMRLDTEPRMHAATAFYRSLGFREIEPYTSEAFPETIFFELDLTYQHRHYHCEADYLQMLRLHRDIFGIVRGPICCTAGELEWWRFQEDDPDDEIATAHLWETTDGALVAYAWPGPTYMNQMVHPGHRELLEPILAWAEERQWRLRTEKTELTTEAVESDVEHVGVLKRRGYEPTGQSRDWRIRSLEAEMPEFDLPAGFSIRYLTSPEDLRQRASLAEHPYAAHLARAPMYRPDLNLAVVAPDGCFTAFCTVWLDEQNRVGVFEPVECLPEFRRRGLTRAMMSEGMRRLRRLGAMEACIVNRNENLPAKRLYESLGFRAVGQITEWRKPIP